ncbi:MAG: polyprenol monophosphomannose synthase [Anaerolineae bacterium]|nr:polyprenol monophosphomannose synthase [Anaerolineae bacterium]
MTKHTRSLIIIPTYNEAENLEPLVSAILALDAGFEILVVDDNSPDGTGEIADRLAAELPQVHVLHRPGKMGLGTAYVQGFEWALHKDYQCIFQMDCDFSHHPRYLPIHLEKIATAHAVIGSRYVPGGGTVNWGWLRQLVSASGNFFARTMLGLHVQDCTGGFRCYQREVIQRIPWDKVRLEGYGFLIGTIYQVQRLGFTITEFPIIFEDRRTGQSKMSFRIMVEAFFYVMRTAMARLHLPSRDDRVVNGGEISL